jgi:hypothetical protein
MTQINTRGEGGGSKMFQKINTYLLNGPLGFSFRIYSRIRINGHTQSKDFDSVFRVRIQGKDSRSGFRVRI